MLLGAALVNLQRVFESTLLVERTGVLQLRHELQFAIAGVEFGGQFELRGGFVLLAR